MSLMTCPECSHMVSDRALACPCCGYPVARPSRRSERRNVSGSPSRKHPKLPNGYGSIKRLSGRRANPYAAYPPTTEYKNNGSPVSVPAIGYYKTWHLAYAAVIDWHRVHNDPICQPASSPKSSLTFSQVYQLYFEDKYRESPGKKTLSVSSRNSTKAAFRNCQELHDRLFCSLTTKDLQRVIDGCCLKHSSLELIVNLMKQMYAYALQNDIAEKDYAQYIRININDDDEGGIPFSPEELAVLWAHTELPDVRMILIMIYSGFRVSAYQTLTVNPEEGYFQGGVKTASGRNRIVPIHSCIHPYIGLVASFGSAAAFRIRRFYPALDSLGILYTASGIKHTPHDCRHTFSWLCDLYGVDTVSKHLLMGHALPGDVESKKYSHRTLDQLRSEIEKIQA
ncbi:MAG: integrase [Ruminococcus flavefaciens]|nr:integrase [Ruminococcus flavefaciens]